MIPQNTTKLLLIIYWHNNTNKIKKINVNNITYTVTPTAMQQQNLFSLRRGAKWSSLGHA